MDDEFIPLPYVSEAAIRAVYIIPMVTAPISFLSSCYLIYTILKTAQSLQGLPPRERLLLGLCVVDLCGSFAFSFSTNAAPPDTVWDITYPMHGTEATCIAQAFLAQLTMGAPLYNAAMGIFYILNIRFNVSDEFLKRRFIPAVHIFIWSLVLSCALAGLVLDIYGFDGSLGCWQKSEHESLYWLYSTLIPISVSFIIIIASMTYLYCLVKRMEARNQRWNFQVQLQAPVLTSPADRNNPRASTKSNMRSSIRSSIQARRQSASMATSNRRSTAALSRRTLETGIMYSLAIIVVYIPSIILAVLPFPGTSSAVYTALMILGVTFLPLQGLFNVLIYTNPIWRPILARKLSLLTPSWCGNLSFYFCCCDLCWGQSDGDAKDSTTSQHSDMMVPELEDIQDEIPVFSSSYDIDIASDCDSAASGSSEKVDQVRDIESYGEGSEPSMQSGGEV